MGFPRQGYWSGRSFSSPEDLPNPGIKPAPPALAGGFSTTEPPGKPFHEYVSWQNLHLVSPSPQELTGLMIRQAQFGSLGVSLWTAGEPFQMAFLGCNTDAGSFWAKGKELKRKVKGYGSVHGQTWPAMSLGKDRLFMQEVPSVLLPAKMTDLLTVKRIGNSIPSSTFKWDSVDITFLDLSFPLVHWGGYLISLWSPFLLQHSTIKWPLDVFSSLIVDLV